MTVVIWIVLAYIFIKCVGLVIKPFLPKEEEYYEEPTNQTTVHIHVQDSFNYHSSDSYYKGGDQYHGSSKKEKDTDNYYHDAFYEAIKHENQRYGRRD